MIGQVLKRTPILVMGVFVLMTAVALTIAWRTTTPLQALTWVAEIKSPLSAELLSLRQNLAPQRIVTLDLIQEAASNPEAANDAPTALAAQYRLLLEQQNARIAEIDRLLRAGPATSGPLADLQSGFDARQAALQRAYGSFVDLARDLIDSQRLGDIETVQALLPELEVEQSGVQAALDAFENKLTAATGGLAELEAEIRGEAFALIGAAVAGSLGIIILFLVLPLRQALVSYRLIGKELERMETQGPEGTTLPPIKGADDPLMDNLRRMGAQLQVRDRLHETFGRHLPDPMIEAVADHGGLAAIEPRMVEAFIVSVVINGLNDTAALTEAAVKAEAIAEIDTWLVTQANSALALRQNRMAHGAVMVLAPPFLKDDAGQAEMSILVTALSNDFPRLQLRLVPILGETTAKTLSLHLGLAQGNVLMGVLGGESGPRLRYDGPAIHHAITLSGWAQSTKALAVASKEQQSLGLAAGLELQPSTLPGEAAKNLQAFGKTAT